MVEDGNKPDKKFEGVELYNLPTDYHTLDCPVFVLEAPLKGGPPGIPKWKPRERTGVYLGQSPFHKVSVELVLRTRTGNFSPQYHVVFDDTLYTLEHMRKGRVPGNGKNLVEEHSEIATQENYTLAKIVAS